jgi:hypothetical protein
VPGVSTDMAARCSCHGQQVAEEGFAKLDVHHTGRLAPQQLKPFVQRLSPPGANDMYVMGVLQQLTTSAEAVRLEKGLEQVGARGWSSCLPACLPRGPPVHVPLRPRSAHDHCARGCGSCGACPWPALVSMAGSPC